MSYSEFAYPSPKQGGLQKNKISIPKKKDEPGSFGFYKKGELPIVLAGPIIRRAEPDSIYIWVATSIEANLGVQLFEGRANAEIISRTYPPYKNRESTNQVGYNKNNFVNSESNSYYKIGEGFNKPISIGSNLFISLIKVEPYKNSTFPRGEELSYEIFVLEKEQSFDNAKLLLDNKERGLITIDKSKTLSPSFFLQLDDPSDLRLAFGSCRKFHGEAKDSTIALFENKYFNNAKVVKNRPNALFLLGDQIYADDVSDLIINYLSNLGSVMIGGYEGLPYSRKITDDIISDTFDLIFPNTLKPHDRQDKICKMANFTSEDGHNHLAALGEYCAIYLLAFNGEIWPDNNQFKNLKKYLQEKYNNNYQKKGGLDNSNHLSTNYYLGQSKLNEILLSKSIKEIDELLNAKKGSEAMRRILANTATYMICDDHEITDDWYITNEWKKTVLNNKLGARIVANGLTAFWFFQGIGNDPIKNNEPGEFDLNKLFGNVAEDRSLFKENYDDKAVLEICTDIKRWTFVAPTTPLTLFLDTRFNRENSPIDYFNQIKLPKNYSGGTGGFSATTSGFQNRKKQIPYYTPENTSVSSDKLDCVAPVLINDGQIEYVKSLFSNINSKGIIIATPAPVFGLLPIENFIEVYKFKQGNQTSFMEIEREAWSCNLYGIDNFIKLLNELYPEGLLDSKIRILSGDVHYSFYNNVCLNVKNLKNNIEIDMLTASGIKNPPMAKPFADILANISVKTNSFFVERKKGKEGDPITLVISDEKNQVVEDYNYTTEIKTLPITKLGKSINEYMWKSGSFGFLNSETIEFIVP